MGEMFVTFHPFFNPTRIATFVVRRYHGTVELLMDKWGMLSNQRY
jgi:hypothetical protein